MKKPVKNQALTTWTALNTFLMGADEAACSALLKEEQRGRKRAKFLLRIHSRINRLRAHRERAAL